MAARHVPALCSTFLTCAESANQAHTMMAYVLLPICLPFLQLTVLYVASLTAPHSPFRVLAVAIQAVLYHLHHKTLVYMTNISWATLFGFQTTLWVAITFERLICSQWNYHAGGPEAYRSSCIKKHQVERISSHQDSFASGLLFNLRGLDRAWEVKTAPPAYPSSHTKTRFVLQRLISATVSLMLLIGAAYQPTTPAHLITEKRRSTLRRIGEVSVEEAMFKVLSAIGFVVSMYATVSCCCDIFAVFCVGAGISDFRSWRTNFGSPLEAYSIRRFWSHFWHQYLRSTLSGTADWVVDGIPFLKRNRVLARYSRIFVAFLVSGLVHIGCDRAAAIPIGESGAVRFFCTQAFGVMIEDAVEDAYRSLIGSTNKVRPKLWIRLVGYIWVLTFMSCSLPLWSFPYVRRHDPGAHPLIRPESLGLV